MRILVLTGAGISAESGHGTFRDKDGLWSRFDPLKLATPEAFAADPATVQAFYDARRRNLLEAKPNAAHHALARLEAALGDDLTLVTQNIDDLHERAGSRRVLHMHGELLKARCTRCQTVLPWREELSGGAACPACAAPLRPHVVWFGEMPFHMDEIAAALACDLPEPRHPGRESPGQRLAAADLFAAIGTSGAVYPAAGFVREARAAGIPTIELNLDPADNTALFDDHRTGPATQTVPAWVDHLLEQIAR